MKPENGAMEYELEDESNLEPVRLAYSSSDESTDINSD